MPINTSAKSYIPSLVSRQVVQIDTDSYVTLNVQGTQARTTNAVQSDLIMAWSDVAFRMKSGDNSVAADANSPLFPANVPFVFKWNPGDYLSTFYDGTNSGTLHLIGVY